MTSISMPTKAPDAALMPVQDGSLYIGNVRARLRYHPDPLDLDVYLSENDNGIEIGPLTFDLANARHLLCLLQIAVSVLSHAHD